MTDLVNYLTNNRDVCRTAPATPGLLKTLDKSIQIIIIKKRNVTFRLSL